MILIQNQKPIASFFLVVFILAQVLVFSSILLMPKPAQAFLGFGDLVIKIGDVYDVLKDIGKAILREIAIKFANKFISRFTNKLIDKYKIKNYLYYDKVLTDYYLNRYIADRVTDPDLKAVYSLLERGFISGAPTGATSGAPDPRKALIPRINQAISNAYIKQGGIDPNKIANPTGFTSDIEYFAAYQSYFYNPKSFTQVNLRGEFGAFQSSATTAAQLEVLVGSGLKAGRVVGGQCVIPASENLGEIIDPASSPQACAAAGGNWKPSALDQARSFIDNPAQFIDKWVGSGVDKILHFNFDPNNYSAMIGTFIGSFLFNQFFLDKPGGVLSEDPRPYVPQSGIPPDGVPVDIDGDGITDGYDITVPPDGQPDVCVYGGDPDGAGPPCLSSTGALNPPTNPGGTTGPTCADVPTATACTAPDHTDIVIAVKNYVIAAGLYTPGPLCEGPFQIVRRVAWALRAEGVGLLATYHTTQCNGFSADIIAYGDGSGVDILGDAGGRDDPTWQPAPANPEPGVYWSPAQDPGDPPGSYPGN